MNTLEELINKLKKTNSTNNKKEILKDYTNNKFVEQVLNYTYNPLIQFGIKSTNVKKFSKSKNYNTQEYQKYNNLFDILDDLKDRKITGHIALKSINEFIKNNKKYEDIIYNIIDKNLKIRIAEKTINKVYNKNVIPVFNPVLAEKFNPLKTKLSNNWSISRKLDGVRCLMYITETEIRVFSRNGKDLYNTELIVENIPSNKSLNYHFLDGELVYLEKGKLELDKEDFKKTIEIVRSKTKVDSKKLYYVVFDIIPDSCFFDEEKCPDTTYFDRYEKLKKYFKNNKRIIVLPQYKYTENKFDEMLKESKKHNWEGLMLRKNDTYKTGRTKDLLKVKEFNDKEYVVKDIITGNFRVISNKTGLEETIKTMTAVIIKNKGVDVKVGSGFSIDERKKFYDNPKLIIGKKITVQYFEETPDKSLRFPIYKGVRDYE